MKKIAIFSLSALVCAAAFGQGAGRKVYRPGQERPQAAGRVETADYRRAPSGVDRGAYDRTPDYGGHVSYSPFALGIGSFGMPYRQYWAICGGRLNLGLPGWTAVYQDVYGLDIGLSGETISKTGAIAVNAFNNTTRDFYGVAVAGLWNRTTGSDTHALQVAGLFNSAEGFDGVQIGLVNRAREFHGVQIGIYNTATSGGGLQIGLWNDNASGVGSPLLGIVY